MGAGRPDWVAAGLLDPAARDADDRLALLDYLHEAGCTLEEMRLADAEGRLFGLAGDRILRPVTGRFPLEALVARAGLSQQQALRFLRAFALPDQPAGTAAYTDDDVRVLRLAGSLADLLGEETALGVARVVGAALARVADAEDAALRPQAALDLDRSASPVATARAWASVAALVPEVGFALDVLHRHHIESVRRHSESTASADLSADRAMRLAVGFADLSGFTALSRRLALPALSRLLSRFDEIACDVVQARGGRVVKLLGDAVMWVAAAPDVSVAVALDLVGHEAAQAAGLQVRAGVVAGVVLAQEGDYFGPPVNLAARLVALAAPGRVLVDVPTAEGLDPARWRIVPVGPLAVRGLDEPVAAAEVSPADPCPAAATAAG